MSDWEIERAERYEDERASIPEPSEVAETTAGEREHWARIGADYGRELAARESPAEPDAGEVEALAKVEGLLGEWQRGEIPVDVVLAHLAALLDRERREAKVEAVREAADAMVGRRGTNPAARFLRAYADQIARDEATR